MFRRGNERIIPNIREATYEFQKTFNIFFILSIVLAVLDTGMVWTTNPYIDIPYEQNKTNEARQLWWNSLSAREKHLVELISKVEDDYKSTSAQYIPVNQQNVAQVMPMIGAENYELNFVFNRMQFYINVDKTSNLNSRTIVTMRYTNYITL